MLLSLCETIVVMHLMEKDSQLKVTEAEDCSKDEDKRDLPRANKVDNGKSSLKLTTTI